MHRNADGSSKNSFLTLTYDEANLPKGQTLVKEHWQNFAKRLRNHVGTFRYLHVGEYGEENFRPHYHALIFGQDFQADRAEWSNNNGIKYYLSEHVAKAWTYGHHIVTDMTPETIDYVCKYAIKKVTGKLREDIHQRVDPTTGECWQVEPQYATHSRRPGIGSAWFDRFSSDVFPSDECILRGKAVKPPKYYLDKLAKQTDKTAQLEKIKKDRKTWAQNRKEDNTPERRKVRGECLQSRIKSRKAGALGTSSKE